MVRRKSRHFRSKKNATSFEGQSVTPSVVCGGVSLRRCSSTWRISLLSLSSARSSSTVSQCAYHQTTHHVQTYRCDWAFPQVRHCPFPTSVDKWNAIVAIATSRSHALVSFDFRVYIFVARLSHTMKPMKKIADSAPNRCAMVTKTSVNANKSSQIHQWPSVCGINRLAYRKFWRKKNYNRFGARSLGSKFA